MMQIKTKGGKLLTISKVDYADLEAILRLQYEAYQSEAKLLNNPNIAPLKQTLDDVRQEFLSAIFLKATDKHGKIIASIRASLIEESVRIGKLIVEPAMQNMGIGKTLLKIIEQFFDCKRFELFTSSKSIRNIGLYKHSGYSIFKEEKINDDLHLIYLEKVIP